MLLFADEKTERDMSMRFEDELERSLGEPEQAVENKPHDIASERWWWTQVGAREGLVQESGGHVNTPKQKTLEAAAPELADKLRKLLQKGNVFADADDAVLDTYVNQSIRLLRKLGVPNVAEWYKGDE